MGFLHKCVKFCGHCKSGSYFTLEFQREPMLVRRTDTGERRSVKEERRLQIRENSLTSELSIIRCDLNPCSTLMSSHQNTDAPLERDFCPNVKVSFNS